MAAEVNRNFFQKASNLLTTPCCSVIDTLESTVQWPAMLYSTHKIAEWRNKDNAGFVKKAATSIGCVANSIATAISSIAKVIFGTIFLIPPFTSLGMTLYASVVFFESQVFIYNVKTAITSLFYQKVTDFRLDLL